MSSVNVRMAWLTLLGAVNTHGAEVALPFSVATLACFGARKGMPRSLASVCAATIARFLPRSIAGLTWRKNVPMKSFGHDVLLAADKSFFWRTTDVGTLEKYSVYGARITYINAPHICFQMAHAPGGGGSIAYVSTCGRVCIDNNSSGRVTMEVAAGCSGICFAGDDMFVCNVVSGGIHRFQHNGWSVRESEFAVARSPRRLCALRVDGEPCIAVTEGAAPQRVSVFNAATGALVACVGERMLKDPFALVFDDATNSLLVADFEIGVVMFDMGVRQRRLVFVFSISGAAGLALHGNTLLVSKVVKKYDEWLVGVFELR